MKINKITLVITLIVLIFCSAFTINKYKTYKNVQKEENRQVELDTLFYEIETTTQTLPVKNYEPDTAFQNISYYSTVKSTNSDIIGWLSFPSAALSMPLMRGSDNDFYLKHSFNKLFSWSGSVFLDYRLPTDLSARNSLIYGHHMPDGSGLTNLFAYENKEFYDSAENKIYIYTEDRTYTYQIFSVAEVEAGTIYTQRVFGSVSFSDFVSTVASASMYDTGVTVNAEDKIISLVTCLTDSSSHLRLIIYAKLLS